MDESRLQCLGGDWSELETLGGDSRTSIRGKYSIAIILIRVSSTFFRTPSIMLWVGISSKLAVIHHILGAKKSTIPRKKNESTSKKVTIVPEFEKSYFRVTFE